MPAAQTGISCSCWCSNLQLSGDTELPLVAWAWEKAMCPFLPLCRPTATPAGRMRWQPGCLRCPVFSFQVFLVRKVKGSDAGQLYAMKVLRKATLKGKGHGRGPSGHAVDV